MLRILFPRKRIKMPNPSKVERKYHKYQEKENIALGSSKKLIISADFPISANLFKSYDSPLRLVAITGIDSTALSLLIPALSSFLGLSSSPLAELVFTFLAARLSDRRRGSEANAVDAFAVVTESSVDVVTSDLRVLPGRVGEVGRILAALW